MLATHPDPQEELGGLLTPASGTVSFFLCIFFFFKTSSNFNTLAGLEPDRQTRLALNS